MSQQKLPAKLQHEIEQVRKKYWLAALHMRLANEAPEDRKSHATAKAENLRAKWRYSVHWTLAIAKKYGPKTVKKTADEIFSMEHLPRKFIRGAA